MSGVTEERADVGWSMGGPMGGGPVTRTRTHVSTRTRYPWVSDGCGYRRRVTQVLMGVGA